MVKTPAKEFNTIIADQPARAINFRQTPIFVSRTWSGTQTNYEGLYPQAISFQLNNAGEFIMADQSGTVAAKGNYSIVGNIFWDLLNNSAIVQHIHSAVLMMPILIISVVHWVRMLPLPGRENGQLRNNKSCF